jgi:hypothetical protein
MAALEGHRVDLTDYAFFSLEPVPGLPNPRTAVMVVRKERLQEVYGSVVENHTEFAAMCGVQDASQLRAAPAVPADDTGRPDPRALRAAILRSRHRADVRFCSRPRV